MLWRNKEKQLGRTDENAAMALERHVTRMEKADPVEKSGRSEERVEDRGLGGDGLR